MSTPPMGHEELQRDLASSFAGNGDAVIERLSLGSYGTAGQMDVFRMRLSRVNPNPTCYEVKVSRSDFNADAQSGKYRRYLPYVRRLYFAAPKGLLAKSDIPADAGLIVRGANGWSVVKAAPIHKPDPDKWPSLLMSIVLKLHPGPWQPPSREQRIHRAAHESGRFRGLALSRRVADALRRADEVLSNEKSARRRLCERLGIDPESFEARDIAVLADRVLDAAPEPHVVAEMVPRPPLRGLLIELQAQERAVTRLRERLESALNGGAS